MRRRTLVVVALGSLAVLAVILTVVLRSGSHDSKPHSRPTPSSSPVIPLTAEQEKAKKLATELIPKWGTYSYQTMDQYAAALRPLVTPKYFQTVLGEPQLGARKRSLGRNKFEIRTSLKEVQSVTDKDGGIQVEAKVDETITDSEGTRHDTALYTVTYVPVGTQLKVSNVAIKK